MNCAPALGNDQRNLYAALNNGYDTSGYLAILDSRTLAPIKSVSLRDVHSTNNNALLDGDATASPTIGPDGDVYFGVVAGIANNGRGWLLHFDSTLATNKIPGSFGWDDTASIVPSSMVPSYRGFSKYLLMTKYNNYVNSSPSGDGVNRIAILDPNSSQTDPVTTSTVMKEVLTIVGPTPDPGGISVSHPNAVKEWCINSAAVDAFRNSILAGSEDGKLYRWDLTANKFAESIVLTPGIGEAYTPTIVGLDGTVYAINNATLFAIGR